MPTAALLNHSQVSGLVDFCLGCLGLSLGV